MPVVLGLAVAYGGLAQLLAGMWEFRRGNAFGAMTFGSYAAFWLSFWVLEEFLVKQIPAAEAGSAMALFFIIWAIFTALLWVASLRTTPAVSVMLALLAVTFLLLGIGDAGAHSELVKIAGWFGIATAAAGLYAAFARADQHDLRADPASAAAGAARTVAPRTLRGPRGLTGRPLRRTRCRRCQQRRSLELLIRAAEAEERLLGRRLERLAGRAAARALDDRAGAAPRALRPAAGRLEQRRG